MKAKKVLAALLSATMVFGAVAMADTIEGTGQGATGGPTPGSGPAIPGISTGITTEAQLRSAIANASAGDTIKIASDINVAGMYEGDSRYALWIDKDITIDGQGHTLTVKNRGIGIKGSDADFADVTIKDLTIVNSDNAGRGIDTRGNISTLTLDNVNINLTGTSGYLQQLTIGGNQASTANVIVKDCVLDATPIRGYGITVFNPANITVTGTTIRSWSCFNLKAPDSSQGSRGSVITVDNCVLTSENNNVGATNDFCMFKFEDNGGTAPEVTVTNSTLNVISDEGCEAENIAGFMTLSMMYAPGTLVIGDGNNVTFTGEKAGFAVYHPSVATFDLVGGTYNLDPSAYVAEGYVAKDNGNGTYSVVKADMSTLLTEGTFKSPVDEEGFYEQMTADTVTPANAVFEVYYKATSALLGEKIVGPFVYTDGDIEGEILCALIITGIPESDTVTIELQ